MKLAILSDIHGNLDALTSVLADIDAHRPDEVICLGDVVGYGAEPSACLALVRKRCSAILLGNHDEAVADPFKAFTFNPLAFAAVEWTSQRMTDDEKSFLAALPLVTRREDILFVHASPQNPEKWDYIIDDVDAEQAFSAFSEKVCCIGHTHSAEQFLQDHSRSPSDSDFKCIVNVGSVGQPRDRDPRSSWCMIDTETLDIRIHRVPYDIESAAEKIRNAGLPLQLADRLFRGT